MKDKLTKLYPTATREQLLKAFQNRNYAAIGNQAIRMGLKRLHPNAAKAAEKVLAPPKAEKALRDKLSDFISRARTDKEILSKFGNEGLAELPQLAKKPPEGFRLKEGRNNFQEKTTYLERVLGDSTVKVKKRVFHLQHSENDPDYIAVTFPPDLDFSEDPTESALRIFPIDSSFWGDYLCDREAVLKFFQYLETKPYAFAFLLGDIIGGTNYTKDTAVEIREDFQKHLAPIAHKILWAQSGPLEAKMSRVDGVDPLHSVCQELGIYHTDRPVNMDVYWKVPNKPIEWTCLHGMSNARKDGAKINAAIDICVTNNFPHFTVLGKLKEGIVNNLTARRLDPVELAVKEHSAITIICSGFQKYEGSLAEKKGYPPPATGTVVGIIGNDNSHKASS
ncbi:hypothetical protein A3C96_03485 [Candidatus Uhrbacteria bacterium RIFCSPHIGHO2_02_FULL_60_10]|uniref:Uncharacterized protein n=1 Tax=Candidatus Uhrbacteria bacterium RIFCSPHIGHO2_02_FULL_60_10 TaxID=1802392 RepID=A0A1F7U3Q0_9BACT|nr:MAG: hypothetical protein A3C96_03485 [Candidatus Uhrbacteria bacterium RIFCSPHIGHO2_02_FULL_60_10]